MIKTLPKVRVALAGAAVVLVMGLATPITLGAVSVAVWSHSGVFDASGMGHLALCVLDAVAWFAWLRIAVGLCADVVSELRHPGVPVRSSNVRGVLAGWVVGLALMVVPTSAMGTGLAGATALVAGASTSVEAPRPAPAPAPTPSVPADPSETNVASAPAQATYTVLNGDCLSTIAVHFYGDEGAWTEIWAANAYRIMGDGARFSDPNLIYAGWTLVLPGLPAMTASRAPGPDTTTPTTTPRVVAPVPPTTVSTLPRAEPNRQADPATGPLPSGGMPKTAETPTTGSPRLSPSLRARPGDTTSGATEHRHQSVEGDNSPPTAAGAGTESGNPYVHWVPESAALGIPSLVAAAYLRRIRRRRSVVRAARGDDEIVVAPDPAAVALEARLTPFADAPVLEWLELANRHLTWALRSEGRADEAPGITVLRVGSAGVEFLLDEALDWAPGAFRVVDDGHTWLLSADLDREALWPSARDELAWLPLLVPVGDDPNGTYLLHLEPGQEVSLGGPEANPMLAAWVQAARSWPWAEQVSVVDDAEAAEALLPLFAGQIGVDERGTAMFAGDPAELSEEGRRTFATVTLEPSEAVTCVVANAERAFIEPFGITVRPCLLGTASAHTLAGIFDGPSRIRAVEDSRERPGAPNVLDESVLPCAEIRGPGPIEVRLLTFTPEIVGMADPLPSSMMVRITELVAWVALQGKKGTTSASMLDHGIAGATATKTVYNMVSAARAALGVDATGAPRLITQRSTGTYRLGDDVTVDVLRFEQMVEHGIDAEDPQLAALLCEAALALIDDIPVGNGTGRYGWWSSQWEARVGHLATKAAGRLAELARHGVIDVEVARRGIERARLAAGGEEALHRVAMVLEAWADNDARVEREWETACAQAEDLEPGGAPSDDTEALLIAIRRRSLDDVLAATMG